jgi:hypothetical protein
MTNECTVWRVQLRRGGMAEWSMAAVLKTAVPGRVPGVRIPLPPPASQREAGRRESSSGTPRLSFGSSRAGTNPSPSANFLRDSPIWSAADGCSSACSGLTVTRIVKVLDRRARANRITAGSLNAAFETPALNQSDATMEAAQRTFSVADFRHSSDGSDALPTARFRPLSLASCKFRRASEMVPPNL